MAGLLLEWTKPVQGIGIAAPCLAAWWRLDPDVAADLAASAGAEVVAAALDKLISRRASLPAVVTWMWQPTTGCTRRRIHGHPVATATVVGPLKPW